MSSGNGWMYEEYGEVRMGSGEIVVVWCVKNSQVLFCECEYKVRMCGGKRLCFMVCL